MKKSVMRYLIAVAIGAHAIISATTNAASPVSVTGLVISSGIAGGGYSNAANRMQDVAADMGVALDVRASEGSMENLDRLTDPESPVNLAFAQADALQYFLSRNPGFKKQFEILENIGRECVFIVTGKRQSIRDDESMQAAKDYGLAIGSASSGVAITFDYMRSLVPELADIAVQYGDTGAALASLNEGSDSVDAVMVVHRPRELSPEVERALNEPDSYGFVAIDDDRLTRKLPSGRRVYHSMNLAMPGGVSGETTSLRTICVNGLLLANRHKLGDRQRDQLADMIARHWMKIYVTR